MESTNIKKTFKRSREEEESPVHRIQDPLCKLNEILGVLFRLKEQGYLTDAKQLPAANIIGEQTTGKSSFMNNLMNEMNGLSSNIAPESSNKCTKFPLAVTGVNLGLDQPKYKLHLSTGVDFVSDNECEIHEKIKGYSENFLQASADPSTSLNLYINTTAPLRIVDFPGGTSNYDNETFLKNVTQIDKGGFPILLYMQRADSCGCDPDQGFMLGEFKKLKKQEAWRNLKIFIVMTFADSFLQKEDSIATYIQGANNVIDNIPGVKLALVQLRDPTNKSASFSEIRQAESSTMSKLSELREIRSPDGSPAVYLGIKELIQAFMEQMCNNVIEDKDYLPLLSQAMNTRLHDIGCQKTLFEKQGISGIIPMEICFRIADWNSEIDVKLKLGNKLHIQLRDLTEQFYLQSALRRQANEEPDQSYTREVMITKGSIQGKYDTIWRQALLDCLSFIANNSGQITNGMLEIHKEQVDTLFKPYEFLPKTTSILKNTFEEFRSEQLMETFKNDIRDILIHQMNLVEKPGNGGSKLKEGFPKDSVFIADAIKGKNKKQGENTRNIVLEVLCTLDRLLDYIQNALIIKYMMTLNNGFKTYIFGHCPLKGPITEITNEQFRNIKEEENTLNTLMPLVNQHLDTIKIQTQEIQPENNQDLEEEEGESEDFDLHKLFGYFKGLMKGKKQM